jgi:ABC-2 type transport system ATP-binding protein
MIEVQAVEKTYHPRRFMRGDSVRVLKGFSMTAQSGQITALVGPNGAGKTTLFRILAGHEAVSGGRVLIHGLDPVTEGARLRGRIALLPEKPDLQYNLTGREELERFGLYQCLSPALIREKVAFIVRELDLGAFVDQRCMSYSRGQAVRMSLARLHMMDPDVFIFDEPTVGLDFESAARVRGWVRKLAGNGATVLLASHLMHDIQGLCHAMVGLRDGVQVEPRSLAGWEAALRATVKNPETSQPFPNASRLPPPLPGFSGKPASSP